MKQRITWDQLMELSFNQVNKLQNIVGQKYHIIKDEVHWEKIRTHKHEFINGDTTNIHGSYTGLLDKLDIGKMIEILHTKHKKILFSSSIYKSDENIVSVPNGAKWKDFEDENELCDALWEAVKSIL